MPFSGVAVYGLADTRKAFKRLGPSAQAGLRNELKRVVETTVLAEARRRIAVTRRPKKLPRSTGAAAASLRAASGGNTVYIMGGKSRVPYYGWLDFGGELKPKGRRRNTQHRPFIKHGRFIYPAIDDKREELADATARAFDTAAHLLDLN